MIGREGVVEGMTGKSVSTKDGTQLSVKLVWNSGENPNTLL